ncbi:hypothetical protein Nepgr_005839 [Nepenthes gracilis]|uniref:Tyrosine specific protein phosphatases domain-containing protein n=1 Tax=Nepenthes gracilis TaxID=150966 RepID=A0AAD3S3X9_NEPGR|nr:hypothetical protein Nepgr_005839 [Nepenthes gracilis]
MASFCRKIVISFLRLNESFGERPWQPRNVQSQVNGLGLIIAAEKVPYVVHSSAIKYDAASVATAIKMVSGETGFFDGVEKSVNDGVDLSNCHGGEASEHKTWKKRIMEMKNPMKLLSPLTLRNQNGQTKKTFLMALRKNRRVRCRSHGRSFRKILRHSTAENESCGKTTYVHCKAGRGRSTTVVLCYLVEHKHMTPNAAYEYVRFIRLLLREFQVSGFEAI